MLTKLNSCLLLINKQPDVERWNTCYTSNSRHLKPELFMQNVALKIYLIPKENVGQ